MKTSIKKLLHHHNYHHHHKHDRKARKIQPLAQLDELAKASEAMQDMRDCYDSLLSAAAAATNSAYEFSESLREMGVCLLQKIALNDDEETGKAMLMLGKVQFELQKQVDGYRSHIFQTITVPSESLINELQTVEDMKHQCDEKRELYEYMKANYRDKGRCKGGKGESFSLQQLQAAKDEFDEDATLFVFRLKSLKQGQSRSLLTQAARHHAAQLSFFKKAVKSLEAVEPHVKLVTQQQHIDYQFSGLEDEQSEDGEDDDANDEDGDESDDDSDASSVEDDTESTFDYRNKASLFNNLSSVKNSTQEHAKGYQEPFVGDRKMLSQSAPLISQRQFDAERIRRLQPSLSRKFHAYVLPTPSENPILQTKSSPQQNHNMFHSYPLEPKTYEKFVGTKNLSGPLILNSNSVLKERNNNQMPPPLTQRASSLQVNPQIARGSIKLKLQSFSGPMTATPLSAKPLSSAGNPATVFDAPRFSSGPIFTTSINRSSSPQKSSNASPVPTPYPRINELHELPRPPVSLSYHSAGYSNFVGFSAPLISRSPENSATNKSSAPKQASMLPVPPPAVSFSSMPLSNPRGETRSPPSRPLRASHNFEKLEDAASPPLSPIMLAKLHPM
ncbi:hypothetical protein RND81_11G001600 [Saponaria officinalis]|uniref:BAR domain-containing protein n=1 Tax=Saponaria officinalis TaxID=3572 RepID=A0AAW1HHS4_SAPOF